jgi:O-antigen/teichoic acid export membrane protein
MAARDFLKTLKSLDRSSLMALVLRGSMWSIAGQAATMLVRLASSLILTRLLFPEAYGVMSLVWMVLFGLAMFSDVGLGPAIMRDKRGNDPDFLNTAWTLQAIRGAALWGASCLIAGPMATFYHQPELAQLIPVAGLAAIFAGFNSTSVFTIRRNMNIKALTIVELSSQVLGSVTTAIWALIQPSAWAIVGGTLASNLATLIASHFFLPGIRNRFRWEQSSLRVLVGFGRWIFLSSVFYFLSVQADRFLLGHYLDMAQLGVYGVAILLSEAVHAIIRRINFDVVLPAYGRVVQADSQRLRSVFYRARLGIDGLLVLPIAALMILGSRVVGMLYDSRYHEAGWMLQVLCVRLIMIAVLTNVEVCLVALGKPQYAFTQNFCRAVWILVSIPIGWSLMGIKGVVWAVALSEIPVFAVLWVGLARNRMLSLRSELRSLLFVGVGALLGFAVLRLLP